MKQIASVRNFLKLPLPVSIYNNLVTFFNPHQEIKMDKLIEKARRKSGLYDFGDEFFMEPLSKLIGSINKDASLHPFGVMITKIRIVNILQNLLRSNYYFKKYPEILQSELDPVLVITGLQRTGTTILHRLIASDPDTRAVHSWEALNPAPFYNRKREKEYRLKLAERSEQGLRYLSTGFFAIHPVEHTAPEEEILLIDTSFISTVAEAIMNVPSFSAWVENADHSVAYEHLKKMMLLLQWQDKRKRWILKSPHHLEFLPYLFKVFPEAKLIQTHRVPEETVASFLSMVYHGRRIFSDHVTPVSLKDHWFRKTQRMIKKGMEYRHRSPGHNILDIYYEDLLRSPAEEVKKIYSFAGWELPGNYMQLFKETLQKYKQYKFGLHHYELADFELTKKEVRDEFSFYYDEYF